MAIKLSSYYWFRNNYLVRSLEDESSEKYWFGGKLSEKDKKNLKFIVGELDNLKEKSNFQKGKPVFSEHVAILNVVELKDVTSDFELATAYLEGIHNIMKNYWVKSEMYLKLNDCFNEMNILPSGDVKEVIDYIKEKTKWDCLSSTHRSSLEHICWKDTKKWEKEKQELKKTNPLEYYNRYKTLQ